MDNKQQFLKKNYNYDKKNNKKQYQDFLNAPNIVFALYTLHNINYTSFCCTKHNPADSPSLNRDPKMLFYAKRRKKYFI